MQASQDDKEYSILVLKLENLADFDETGKACLQGCIVGKLEACLSDHLPQMAQVSLRLHTHSFAGILRQACSRHAGPGRYKGGPRSKPSHLRWQIWRLKAHSRQLLRW